MGFASTKLAQVGLQAARSGDDDAEFYLGALYSAGVGLPASDEEAFRWFSRAAEQGHSHAMLILAGLYAIGRGIGKDDVKAYKWAYIVAAASRVEEFRHGARQLMGVLDSRMTPEQTNLAKSDASNWRAAGAGRTKVDAPGSAGKLSPPASTTANAPAPVAAPNPASVPSVVNARPSPTITLLPAPAPKAGNDRPELHFSKAPKKDDIDNLLEQVPQGLRKRFGF